MRVTIRPGTDADSAAVAELASLGERTLRKTYVPRKEAARRASEAGAGMARLVAVAGDRIVGALEHRREEGRIHFRRLAVHPDWRRKGVARRLVEHLAAIGERQGARALSLYTVKETGNVPVFQRLGFEAVRESEAGYLRSDRFARLTDVYMERPIRRA